MKKAKRILAITMILTMCVLSFSGCGKSGQPSDEAKAEEVIRIGYVGPLTGDGTPWGTAELNALKMLVDETNASGGVLGKKLELKYYDNRMDNVETTNAARKLIEQDKVVAIIGTNSSSASIALAGVCDSYKIPHIATTATNPSVTVKDGSARPYSFRITLTDAQLGAVMANYAADELKTKTAAILYEIGSDYSMGEKDAFQQAFEAKGGKITTVEAYKTGDVDFRAQLAKISATNSDAIFIPALYKEISLISTQAKALGIKSQLLGSDSWLNYDLFTLARDAVQGAYSANTIDVNDPGLDDFKARFKNKFGVETGGEGGNAFFAHDAFVVLIDAINRVGKIDSVALRDALEETKDVKGLTTSISINKETHNPQREGVVLKIEGDSFNVVSKVMP